MTETIDTIAHRCGRTTKAGAPCRTPVVHPGAACGSHRPTPPVHATIPTTQDRVAAFVESYQCPGCDATVDLFAAGPAQLIVVGHAAACPQLALRVSWRYAA
jgi:hypothetical protein